MRPDVCTRPTLAQCETKLDLVAQLHKVQVRIADLLARQVALVLQEDFDAAAALKRGTCVSLRIASIHNGCISSTHARPWLLDVA
jgi:hypothetical protein